MVERILRKLAVLSVWWRRFHGAEKNKRYRENVVGGGEYDCVCHMQAFTGWNTQPAERKTETQTHREKGRNGQRERDG